MFFYLVRFQVLMATNVKMTVFWDVVPCNVTEISLMMEVVSTSETG
jgi:hypothetical protein